MQKLGALLWCQFDSRLHLSSCTLAPLVYKDWWPNLNKSVPGHVNGLLSLGSAIGARIVLQLVNGIPLLISSVLLVIRCPKTDCPVVAWW